MKNKGFSTIELLITVGIIATVATFSFPRLHTLSNAHYVQNESRRLYLFLQKIRTKAEHTNSKWLILLEQTTSPKNWCVVAFEKSDDGIPISLCEKKAKNVQIYSPFFPDKTQLSPYKTYPNHITVFNGVRGSAKPNSFILQAGDACMKFIFNNTLDIKMESVKC